MISPNYPLISDFLGVAGSLCLAKPWFTDFRYRKYIDSAASIAAKGAMQKRQMKVAENFRQTLDMAPAGALIWMRSGILLIIASFLLGGAIDYGLL